MPKVKIAGIDIDTDAHKNNSKEHRAAIFAHLQGEDKETAVAELEEHIAKAKAKEEKGVEKPTLAEPAK